MPCGLSTVFLLEVFCSLLELLSPPFSRLLADRHLDVSRELWCSPVFYHADWTSSVASLPLWLVPCLLFLLLTGFLPSSCLCLSVRSSLFPLNGPSSSRSLRLECWALPYFLLLSHSQAVGNWSIFTHFVTFGSGRLLRQKVDMDMV